MKGCIPRKYDALKRRASPRLASRSAAAVHVRLHRGRDRPSRSAGRGDPVSAETVHATRAGTESTGSAGCCRVEPGPGCQTRCFLRATCDQGGQEHGWGQPAAQSAAACATSSAASSTNIDTIPLGSVAYATYMPPACAFATTAVAPSRCVRIHEDNVGLRATLTEPVRPRCTQRDTRRTRRFLGRTIARPHLPGCRRFQGSVKQERDGFAQATE
jgi:hypothetical protein